MAEELWQLSAVEQARMVRTARVSAREMLQAHLERIEAVNPSLNALVALDPSVAESRAAAIDEAVANQVRPGLLAGVVTAHKDLTDTADFVTTYGSPIYENHRPRVDGLLVSRMKEVGAVAVGKTNTPEFGAGSHTFNPVYGVTRNPYDPTRTAGGSSGGAAVALRAGMVGLADGSDLGGSLRNPAAWNNVVGFRGSARTVPSIGPGNPWNPMPITGPMGRSVDDVILLLRVLAQPHPDDPLSRELLLPPVVSPPRRPPRVAWSANLGGLPVEPEITEVLDRFRVDMEILGWEIGDDEPDLSGADECFITLRAFMFAARSETMPSDLSEVKETVRDEIERGRALSSEQVSGAYAHLGVLWRRSIEFFDRYDLLIAPVTQVSPFPVEVEYPTEVNGVAMASYVHWMLACCRITATGCPALSLPGGFTDDGMPVGVQLIGRPNGDVALLEAAKALEATTAHGTRGPDL